MTDPRMAAELDALAIIVGELIVGHCSRTSDKMKELIELSDRVTETIRRRYPGGHAGGDAAQRSGWAQAIAERAFMTAKLALRIS